MRSTLREGLTKTRTPRRVAKLPPEVALRFRVRESASLRHYPHRDLACEEPSEPAGHARRWLCSNGRGEVRKPFAPRRKLIVHDVEYALRLMFDARTVAL